MLIPISNTPRDYSWGSVDLIPALEGREPTGRPEAEVWYGDHPGCPSVVADDHIGVHGRRLLRATDTVGDGCRIRLIQ